MTAAATRKRASGQRNSRRSSSDLTDAELFDHLSRASPRVIEHYCREASTLALRCLVQGDDDGHRRARILAGKLRALADVKLAQLRHVANRSQEPRP